MFKENVEEIQKADHANSIPSAEYEGVITEVRTQKAKEGGFASWVVTLAVEGGEFDGCEYPSWVTHSPKAAGVRAAFYRNIGYVTPEDGNVDENDFIGNRAKMTIENKGNNPRILRLAKSAHAPEETEQSSDDNAGF